MDEFKKTTLHIIGPGGLRCQCCDNGYCRKRKSKRSKHALSQLRRSIMKRKLIVQIKKVSDDYDYWPFKYSDF